MALEKKRFLSLLVRVHMVLSFPEGRVGNRGYPGSGWSLMMLEAPFVEMARADVSQVWEWGADNPLSHFNYPLQGFPFCRCANRVPDCTTLCQDALNCAAVEVDQQFSGQSVAP